jgi:hypothetical protein
MFLTGIKKIVKKVRVVSLYYVFLNKYEVLYEAFILKISPILFVKHRYKKIYEKSISLQNPETFDEKLLWLMLN